MLDFLIYGGLRGDGCVAVDDDLKMMMVSVGCQVCYVGFVYGSVFSTEAFWGAEVLLSGSRGGW